MFPTHPLKPYCTGLDHTPSVPIQSYSSVILLILQQLAPRSEVRTLDGSMTPLVYRLALMAKGLSRWERVGITVVRFV
jgi:hypothetical protein